MGSIKTCLLWMGVIILSSCEAYKFLVVVPLVSRSHANLGDGVVRHLLNDGHEVMYISTFPYKDGHHPRLREIDVHGNSAAVPQYRMNMQTILSNTSYFDDHLQMTAITLPYSRLTLENKNVLALMNDPNEHFDAAIVEWTYNELLGGLASIFNCPLIWLSPIELDWAVLDLVGETSNPAYTAAITSFNEPPFTFNQRIEELWTQIRVRLYKYMYFDKEEKELYDKLVAPVIRKRGREPPSYYDIQYNASLVLANTYLTTGLPISAPQNYKAIAGYYISENIAPLPEDLQTIFNNSKHGVIYFSMGTTMLGSGMPDTMRRSLLKMFGTLKQTVIWKFEVDMTDVPKNVHILKFAPQFSILSHPKCKIFITHGGLLSTTEAVHFAVPIIGIPMFLDQYHNINRVIKNGIGRRVAISSPNFADDLKMTIEEIISNPSYAEKAKELSFIYHDRPVKPGAELVHWVKHVVRTRGATHLRSPATYVQFYQQNYLDLLALIVLSFVAISILCTNCFFKYRRPYFKKNKLD